jgi:hypothetical protein
LASSNIIVQTALPGKIIPLVQRNHGLKHCFENSQNFATLEITKPEKEATYQANLGHPVQSMQSL